MAILRRRQQNAGLKGKFLTRRSNIPTGSRRRKRTSSVFLIFICVILTAGGIIFYSKLLLSITNEGISGNDKFIIPSSFNKDEQRNKKDEHSKEEIGMRYQDWVVVATKLAALPPDKVIEELNEKDPFGTRKLGRDLIEEETRLQRSLNMSEFRQLFSCPVDRITLPDMRSAEKAQAFRNGDDGTFIFFQHLRKAGGTHFCTLAKKNLPKKALSSYYCMPDMGWKEHGAGYLHHYSNQDIIDNMKKSGYRIAGNEWDQFRLGADSFFDLPALFATSFRSPLDRAVSQFRFECLEGRGCHFDTIEKFWKARGDLKNVYTWTFSDHRGRLNKAYHGTTSEQIEERVFMLKSALDTVAQFHLVLDMEWLEYAAPLVQKVLGFDETKELTHRVRPHIGQAKREGENENKMGSASIAKASYDAKEYLEPSQYIKMSSDLALDEVLTDAARRMFLERLVCDDV
jgi:hypothetical protein